MGFINVNRPLLRSRVSKDITLILENDYKTFIQSRGKLHFKQSNLENEQELMYALLISHIDDYIQKNDYISCALLYIYFLNNPNILKKFYMYYETSDFSLENYVIVFVKELSSFEN